MFYRRNITLHIGNWHIFLNRNMFSLEKYMKRDGSMRDYPIYIEWIWRQL